MNRLHSSGDARQNRRDICLDVSVSNECGLLGTWPSQLGGFVDSRGPASDHERDIVQYGAYSAFVDKWIFMLIKSDSDMSENCGECGIILTARSNTRTTVVLSVCGLLLCGSSFLFSRSINLEQCASCTELGIITLRYSHCVMTKVHSVMLSLAWRTDVFQNVTGKES